MLLGKLFDFEGRRRRRERLRELKLEILACKKSGKPYEHLRDQVKALEYEG